jgi:hypothetical protein
MRTAEPALRAELQAELRDRWAAQVAMMATADARFL